MGDPRAGGQGPGCRTCSSRTSGLRCRRASASDSRIMLSSCLGRGGGRGAVHRGWPLTRTGRAGGGRGPDRALLGIVLCLRVKPGYGVWNQIAFICNDCRESPLVGSAGFRTRVDLPGGWGRLHATRVSGAKPRTAGANVAVSPQEFPLVSPFLAPNNIPQIEDPEGPCSKVQSFGKNIFLYLRRSVL